VPSPSRSGARVAHIGIAVQSVDALLPFYRDVLGLELVADTPLGGTTVAIFGGFDDVPK